MKVPSLSVVFFIHFLSFGWPCSDEEPGVIDNAFLKCSTNESCAAQCYPGYVFPSGETQINYSCKDGVWAPITSACKRIPDLYIEYAAIWSFYNVIPNNCANITIQLNNSENMLEEAFSKACKYLFENLTVHFTFETLAFTVTTVFSTEYANYTRKNVDTCSDVLQLGFKNLMIGKVFDNITCEKETANYTLSRDLQIRDEYAKCPKGMEIKNVSLTEFVNETVKHFCDYQDITPVTNSVTNVRDGTTAQLTDVPDTTMPHHTYISNSTVSMLTNSDVTTHLNELPTVSTTFDDNDKRTISYPVENTHETVINRLTTDVQAVVYIGASAGGVVFVILVVIIAVVCRKKRSQRPGGHSKALEMDVCSNSDDSFKGELIENTLYQSADGFDNKGATMNPAISAKDMPYIPLSNSTEQLQPDLNIEVEHPSNQTDETKLSNFINKNMDSVSNSAPIEDDCTKLSHILNPGDDEYAVISKSDKNT